MVLRQIHGTAEGDIQCDAVQHPEPRRPDGERPRHKGNIPGLERAHLAGRKERSGERIRQRSPLHRQLGCGRNAVAPLHLAGGPCLRLCRREERNDMDCNEVQRTHPSAARRREILQADQIHSRRQHLRSAAQRHILHLHRQAQPSVGSHLRRRNILCRPAGRASALHPFGQQTEDVSHTDIQAHAIHHSRQEWRHLGMHHIGTDTLQGQLPQSGGHTFHDIQAAAGRCLITELQRCVGGVFHQGRLHVRMHIRRRILQGGTHGGRQSAIHAVHHRQRTAQRRAILRAGGQSRQLVVCLGKRIRQVFAKKEQRGELLVEILRQAD